MATASTTLKPLSGDLLIDAATNGYYWSITPSDSTITYSVSGGLAGESLATLPGLATSVQAAFATIGQFLEVEFVYVGSFADPAAAAQAGSNINIAPDAVLITELAGNDYLGVAMFPNVADTQAALGSDFYVGAEGDVFININSPADTYGYMPGEEGFSLLLHEIGHALGLKHPHDDGGTGRPTFEEAGFAGLDIDWLTVMSYGDDFNWNLSQWDPATPMILDVIALQYLYGANAATGAGDTTYEVEVGTNTYTTLFDNNGSNTLDFSASPVGLYIELPSYELSEEQVSPFGLAVTIDDAVELIFTGSPHSLSWFLGSFETVIGSAFYDLIYGSEGADTIIALDGDDDIYPGPGDDTIDGGEGVRDWVHFLAPRADSTVTEEDGFWIVETPEDGTNRLTGIEAVIFDFDETYDFTFIGEFHVPTADDVLPGADGWRTFMGGGQIAELGGKGQVFGSTEYQHVTIYDLPGLVALDPSFNRGGDLVSFEGDAAEWYVRLEGSNALFSDGDTYVRIPVGTTGMKVLFDDGGFVLRYNAQDGEVRLDSQVLGAEFGQIEGAPRNSLNPAGADEDARGKTFLAEGGELHFDGNLDVFGTNGGETLVAYGGDVVFDASFNRGGDIVYVSAFTDEATAQVSGSSVRLDMPSLQMQLPVGTVGMEIDFYDQRLLLVYDAEAGQVMIGDVAIGTEATPLFEALPSMIA